MILAFVAVVRPERLQEYKALHDAIWPEYLALLRSAEICDLTIHLDEQRNLLFMRFSYVGQDLETDFARLEAQSVAQAWAEATGPYFVAPNDSDDPWTSLSPVFAC